MPKEWNKEVFCRAKNVQKYVSFHFTENTTRTSPPVTITMVACDYQSECPHNECCYKIGHLTECTKEYVNV
jgi:hypothetical protein